jgi:hypothetical protein
MVVVPAIEIVPVQTSEFVGQSCFLTDAAPSREHARRFEWRNHFVLWLLPIVKALRQSYHLKS